MSNIGDDLFHSARVAGAREHHTDKLENTTRAPFLYWAREYADEARCQGGIEIQISSCKPHVLTQDNKWDDTIQREEVQDGLVFALEMSAT